MFLISWRTSIALIKEEFLDVNSQLDIVIDIVSRDGKCIMKQEWFGKLYEKEILNIQQKIKTLSGLLGDSDSEIEDQRKRDYQIYKTCLKTACQ